MSSYYRVEVPGGTYFLTLVTHRRSPLFRESPRATLRDSIGQARDVEPFDLVDLVLLPDPLHLLMRLPADDAGFVARVADEELCRA